MNCSDASSPSTPVVVRALLFIAIASSMLGVCWLQAGNSLFTSDEIVGVNSSRSPENVTSEVTVVTAFFQLEKSKHSLDDYRTWMKNFVGQIEVPLVIYTAVETVSLLAEIRGSLPAKFVTDWTPFTMPPLRGVQKVYTDYQHTIDPERSSHGPELYATWNGKPWMVANAARRNYYNSEFFFWVDIGSFRTVTNFHVWPHVPLVRRLFEKQPKSMLLGGIYQIPSLPELQVTTITDEAAVHREFIEGTFFGGGIDAVQWWEEQYYRAHDTDLAQGRFVGKDQHLMDKVAALNHWRVQMVVAYDQGGCRWDPWFYFQPFLASDDELPSGCEKRMVWRPSNPAEMITDI